MYTAKDVATIGVDPFRASVQPAVLRFLLAHARREAPGECCGILLGRMADDTADVCTQVPAVNLARDVSRRFLIDGKTVLAAQRAGERTGLDVVGFYHSHPRGDARPSTADAEEAPAGYLHLIIATGQVRAWRRALPDSPLEEVPL